MRQEVTEEFLNKEAQRLVTNKYPISKWILFCAALYELGFTISVCKSKTTKSRYIYVKNEGSDQKTYKVRFSEHVANMHLSDCDFYVGPLSNNHRSSTKAAFRAVMKHFNLKRLCPDYL